ncbi:glycosyltransferase [Coleofasciculus sp.]|uniref:glycosyltransferase n=1 Tax=Coleofasciculus sp. TaxID=3100458 RepID=UPI003A3AC0F3
MLALANQTRLHLWFPNIFEFKGGIQVYSAFLLEALQTTYPQVQYDVFLKHDNRCPSDLSVFSHTNFHYSGSLPLSLRTPGFAAQLIASAIWQRPNLVITSHLNFTVAAYWLKRLTGIPYWSIAHGVEAWNIQRPALQTALQQADRILAVSSYTRDRLLKKQNLDPNQLSILPNTFDPHRFEIRHKPTHLLKRYQLKPEQPIILTVNRLSRRESYKGYEKIIEALPQIRQALPQVHYIIVGKGDDRPRLEQFIRERQLKDWVTLAGFIPDAELCDYYNLCDVFAMPSKLEGFGIVYLEALACGKPTLGGNQDGAIDALCQGELGALVDPDDVDAIAQTLIQILQGTYPNPLMYQPEALRQAVIDRFGFDRFKQKLVELMQSHSAIFISHKS